jgi:hypothetical protein
VDVKKKIFVALLFLAICLEANAQRKKIQNVPEFDRRKIHFGFTFGYNSTDFHVHKKSDLSLYDSLVTIESQPVGGFNVGILADYHITPVLNLRFTPALSFSQRNLEYTFRTQEARYSTGYKMITKRIESNFIEFPLLIKYRSARLNNFAAYIIGGFNYRIDLASQKDAVSPTGEEFVKLASSDLSYEIGIGFDFFMEYGWKFSPELKFSFGMPNILIPDKTIWTRPIDRLTSRIIVISFHFEG